MAVTLNPIITGTPGYPPSYNVGMAETFSWIPIENDANRPLFARAGYITNLKDLSISLSASDINIGGVELVDGDDHAVRVKIAQLGTGKGNALQIVEMNPLTSITILGTTAVSGSVTILNTVSSVSVTNQLTGVSVTNDVQVHASSTLPISGSVTVSNILSATLPGTVVVSYADSPQLDPSGRLRVSSPQTQWSYNSVVDKDGDLRYIESFTGGASSIYVQNLASVNMTSGTTSVSGRAIRVSRRRHRVVPGLSHLWNATINFDGKQDNTIKRSGIYTQYNGYFFELSGSDMNVVVRRRLIDGTLVEERVNQNDWNTDKLNGSGPSGENWNVLTQTAAITGWTSTTPLSVGSTVIYNVVYGLSAGAVGTFRQGTKATITNITPATYNATALISNTNTSTNSITATYLFNPGVSASNVSGGSMYQTGQHMGHSYWIDFIGGRTNKVRFGLESDNGPIVLHQFKFGGLLGTSYENAPSLTERTEIINFGAVTSLPSLTIMGNSFSVEAIPAVDTSNFGVAYNNNGLAFAADGVERPVIGIAIRAGEPYQRSDMQLQNISFTDLANNGTGGNSHTIPSTFFWRLLFNPGLSGVPASTNVGKSTRQWAYTTATALTGGNGNGGGIELMGGYITSSVQSVDMRTSLDFLNMGSNVDNTDSDRIVLVIKCLHVGSEASNVVASMNFKEVL